MKKIKANNVEELRKELTERLTFFNYAGAVFDSWVEDWTLKNNKHREVFDTVNGFVWALYACGAITDNQKDNILQDAISNY